MTDTRIEKVEVAERELEAIGDELLQGLELDDAWRVTAFGLAADARSQHRALLYGLAGPTPRVEQIHARPIVETAILIDYIADEPDVRVWEWVAHGPRKQRTLLTEWLKAVECGDDSSALPEELSALIAQKAAEIVQFEKQAKEAAKA
jgi:hypothetical protein